MGKRNPIKVVGGNPKGEFVQVVNELARDLSLSHAARSVMLYLASHQDGYEVSAVSIAAEMGLSNARVIRAALTELDAARWLAIKSLPGKRREYFVNRSGRFSEVEHAALKAPDLAPNRRKTSDDHGPKWSKTMDQNGPCTMDQNGPTKNTNNNTNSEHTGYVSNAGVREDVPEFDPMMENLRNQFVTPLQGDTDSALCFQDGIEDDGYQGYTDSDEDYWGAA